MSKLQLVLIADDRGLRSAVSYSFPEAALSAFGLSGLLTAANVLSDRGAELVAAAESADAVLAEWHLEHAPILNTICFHIRRNARTPVFMVTTGGQEDQIAAIAAGGDDALGLPIYPPMLQAKVMSYRRLSAAARQSWLGEAEVGPKANGQLGPLKLDRAAHRCFVRELELELTPREFGLLDYLIDRANELCTRDDILDQVWGITFDTGTNMVDVYMHFLRKKLEAHGLASMIQTIRGRGYRLVEPPEEPA